MRRLFLGILFALAFAGAANAAQWNIRKLDGTTLVVSGGVTETRPETTYEITADAATTPALNITACSTDYTFVAESLLGGTWLPSFCADSTCNAAFNCNTSGAVGVGKGCSNSATRFVQGKALTVGDKLILICGRPNK